MLLLVLRRLAAAVAEQRGDAIPRLRRRIAEGAAGVADLLARLLGRAADGVAACFQAFLRRLEALAGELLDRARHLRWLGFGRRSGRRLCGRDRRCLRRIACCLGGRRRQICWRRDDGRQTRTGEGRATGDGAARVMTSRSHLRDAIERDALGSLPAPSSVPSTTQRYMAGGPSHVTQYSSACAEPAGNRTSRALAKMGMRFNIFSPHRGVPPRGRPPPLAADKQRPWQPYHRTWSKPMKRQAKNGAAGGRREGKRRACQREMSHLYGCFAQPRRG